MPKNNSKARKIHRKSIADKNAEAHLAAGELPAYMVDKK